MPERFLFRVVVFPLRGGAFVLEILETSPKRVLQHRHGGLRVRVAFAALRHRVAQFPHVGEATIQKTENQHGRRRPSMLRTLLVLSLCILESLRHDENGLKFYFQVTKIKIFSAARAVFSLRQCYLLLSLVEELEVIV
jgi:hypothetical protein